MFLFDHGCDRFSITRNANIFFEIVHEPATVSEPRLLVIVRDALISSVTGLECEIVLSLPTFPAPVTFDGTERC